MGKYIAITGGIGSGKSTVLQFLQQNGFSVFSCDEIYKEIVRQPTYTKKIGEIFPSCVENNQINKKALAEIVFSDEEKRKQLNAIAHPLIMENLLQQMQTSTSRFVFAEVPLLFEGNYQTLFDEVWVVLRDKAARIKAIKKRDCRTRQQIKDTMQSQFDYHTKSSEKLFSDEKVIVFKNNGSKEELEMQIKQQVERL